MQPTPEQVAIGVENFYSTIGSEFLRRRFLKECNAAELTSGNGLGAKYFGYGTVEKPVRVAFFGTGDEGSILLGAINPKYVQVVAIADIRPYSIWRAFHGDNYTPEIKQLRTGLIEKYGWKDETEARSKVRVYGDYRELLAKEKDHTDPETAIEAVIIGLPLFLHAPASVAAMKAGYHVLTEKLMGHTVANCKEMARAAELYQKHLATGHQRHYNVLYDHAKYLIASGVLGDLHYIRAQWHRNNQPGKDSWQPPMPKAAKETDAQAARLDKELANWTRDRDTVQKNIDKIQANDKLDDATKESRCTPLRKEIALWDVKIAQKQAQIADAVLVTGGDYEGTSLKSAADYGYVDDPNFKIEGEQFAYNRPALEELIRWRLFDRTSAGLMAELGSHQLDAASIFIASVHGGEKQLPLSVSCSAIRSLFPKDLEDAKTPLDRNADDHIHCVFDFPSPGYDPKDEKLGKLRRITVAYSSINGNGFGGYGEVVFGTKGTLLIDKEKEASFYRGADIESKTRIEKKDGGALSIELDDAGDPLSRAIGLQATFGDVSRGYCEQIEHWAYCIRNNEKPTYSDADLHDPEKKKLYPRCYPAVALNDAVIALTTNIAGALGETVLFDPAWFDYKSDATPEEHFAKTPEAKKEFTPSLEREMYK